MCTIGKEENLYVKEFITYYKKLGIDHIFIYDNNELNGEKFEDVINDEIQTGFVSIINYRGYKGIQIEAYYDCYQNNYKKYKWLSFFDFDEYLEIIPRNKTLKQFLNSKIFENCQSIKVNGLLFTDNDLVTYENKTLQERFTVPGKLSKMIKSIVKGNLNINFWEKAKNVHTSYYIFQSCYPSGKPISLNPSNSRFSMYAEGSHAILKHYYKTIDEYTNKLKKGRANIFNLKKDRIIALLNDYFRINKKTKEKLKIIKKNLNFSFKI